MVFSNAYIEPMARSKKELSIHAKKRISQRGISSLSVPLVKAFGQEEFDGRGGIRYLMTSSSIKNLCRVVGFTQKVDALEGVYIVVSAADGTVITVGHHYH
jgi:hypothetical protein